MLYINENIDLKELPPTASEWGKNCMTHKCEAKTGPGGTNSVNICMHVVKAHNEGRLQDAQFPKCHQAIADGTCTAVLKRQEEEKAGHALYYQEYLPRENRPDAYVAAPKPKKVDRDSDSYKSGWNRAGKDSKKDLKIESQNTYQDAINNAVKESDKVTVSSVLIAVGKRVMQALEKGKPNAMKDPNVKKTLFQKVMLDTCKKNNLEITSAQVERVYLQV